MQEKVRCMIVDDEPTARDVLTILLAKIPMVEIVATCANAMEAFHAVNTQTIELIFLDINMPEISGLAFAKTVSKDTKIIFTTAYREFAIDGFDLRAVDYLLKPIAFDRLLQAVHNYLETRPKTLVANSFEQESQRNYSFIRSDRKMIKVVFSDVAFVESCSDYVKIHLQDKSILTRQTISNIEATLPTNEFMRIHRSFIVRVDAIQSFTNEQIEVQGKELPISRPYKKDVLARLNGMG